MAKPSKFLMRMSKPELEDVITNTRLVVDDVSAMIQFTEAERHKITGELSAYQEIYKARYDVYYVPEK